MSPSNSMPPEAGGFPDRTDLKTIVLLHEDDVAERRAQKTIARLVEGFDERAIVRRQSWSFDELAAANNGHEVGAWLHDADIIFVASRRHRQVPLAIGMRLEQWLQPQADHPTTLVALGLVSSKDGSSSKALFSSLEPLCTTRGVRFLSSSVPMPANRLEPPYAHAYASCPG